MKYSMNFHFAARPSKKMDAEAILLYNSKTRKDLEGGVPLMVQGFLPGEVLAITAQAADRLLKLDSGDAALLYLRLLRRGDAGGLKWTDARLQNALEQLRSQGQIGRASCRERV